MILEALASSGALSLGRPGRYQIRPRLSSVPVAGCNLGSPLPVRAGGLLLGAIPRLNSAHRLEWLARSAGRKETGLGAGFGDHALAYFTERLDPEVIRHRTAATLKLAKRNKVFEETAFIGLAIDGTGAGRSTKGVCPLCHPVQDSQGKLTSQIHHFVMISVAGAGITLRFDVEP